VAQFIAFDDAPFGLMKRVRLGIGKRVTKEYGLYWSLAELLNCPYCVGMWVSLLIVIIFRPDYFILYWLAIAGGQAWLETMSQSR